MWRLAVAIVLALAACGPTAGADDDDDGGGGGGHCGGIDDDDVSGGGGGERCVCADDDVGPSDEICDGLDNDCDGDTDEDLDDCGVACEAPDFDVPDEPGSLVFVLPYRAPAQPPSQDASAATEIARADVVILMDTSGSMTGTVTRIQGQFASLVTALAGTVDDLAFGFAGYGDFPSTGGNSEYDVPFYLVHRVMTARTAAGLASLTDALAFANIITDGLGPWWAIMRGGDEPEQGWEGLRQTATGVGITYPLVSGGTDVVPAFSSATAWPPVAPAGEEIGAGGGVGFREGAQPIIIQVTDTDHHAESFPGTSPASATRAVAFAALDGIGAKVLGLNAFYVFEHADLDWIANETGAFVTPEAWGTGAERPADCPVGKCCVVAQDPDRGGVEVQPDPVGGQCLLVFRNDRYDSNLGSILAQAVTAVVRGGHYRVSARVTGPAAALVRAVSACGADAVDTDGDGVDDTYPDLTPGATACFRVTAEPNTTRPGGATAERIDGTLELLAAGRPSLRSVPLTFLIPPACD